MITLLLLFAFRVASAAEMACVGSIQEMKVPEDVYIAGVNDEGTAAFGSPGRILYLNGPGVQFLKPGSVQRVIRPEGKLRDEVTRAKLGIYYKDIGTIRIEEVEPGTAVARIVASCEGILKGDLVVPSAPRTDVDFKGSLSTDATPIKGGLTSTILMGKHDARQLAAGQFCFIQLGRRDGIQPGDRFVVFRYQPSFDSRDMQMKGSAANALYSPVRNGLLRNRMNSMLHDRTIPPKVLGDIVIVETGEGISTGKIVNSLSEINPGDFVVKR